VRETYSVHLAIVTGALIVVLAVIFALIQSPDLLELTARSAPAIPHPLEGYGECEVCHGVKAEIPYSIRHLGWSNASCTRCHAPSDTDAESEERRAGIRPVDGSGEQEQTVAKRIHE
jgi:hypothetical protein